MATFRKYGGINRSPILNYVKHDILSSNSSSFITSGLSNSKETFLSDIDMSGNSIINVNKIIFKDGYIIDGSLTLNPTLAQVLSNGNSAGSYNIDMNGNTITNIGYLNQTIPNNINLFNSKCQYSNNSIVFNNSQDIPNKQYVDNIASGISPTNLCDCATTEDISLNLPGPILTTIDGVSLTNGMRVLVKCQDSSNNVSSANINNGIYVYSTTGYTRATDCSGQDVTNQLTFISDGTLNGMKAFVQYLSGAIARINNLQYVPFYSINYNLGQGLEIVGGSTLQVDNCLNFLRSATIIRENGSNGVLDFINKENSVVTPNSASYIYQSEGPLLIFNNYSNRYIAPYVLDNIENNFGFYCDSSYGSHFPLLFNARTFTLDLSSNAPGANSVKYIANNSTVAVPSYNIGHNFYGNVFLNTSGSYIQFPDGSKQYSSNMIAKSNIFTTDIYNNTNTINFSNISSWGYNDYIIIKVSFFLQNTNTNNSPYNTYKWYFSTQGSYFIYPKRFIEPVWGSLQPYQTTLYNLSLNSINSNSTYDYVDSTYAPFGRQFWGMNINNQTNISPNTIPYLYCSGNKSSSSSSFNFHYVNPTNYYYPPDSNHNFNTYYSLVVELLTNTTSNLVSSSGFNISNF